MKVTPPAVRILPMDSKDEPGFAGCDAETIQRQFFLGELIRADKAPGRFCYRRSGLNAEPGTIILFQFTGKIIASARLLSVEKYKPGGESGYGGALMLDESSIQVFDPVGHDTIVEVWPEVKRLGQAKWSLDPAKYAAFQKRLTNIESASR